MVVSALKRLGLLAFALCLLASSVNACFGPKVFIGVPAGLEGEMRYHLIAIYLHEKTGIDSTQIVLKPGQSALDAIASADIDLGFDQALNADIPVLMTLADGQRLYSGPRPLNDLQFSTLGRALKKLDQILNAAHLAQLHADLKRGVLPATAVRALFDQQGWL